jgi:Spy/CpxP family protein refolding chaperone
MKPAIASLALAIVFCGHAMVRKSFLAFAALGQGLPSSLMNPSAQGHSGMHPRAERDWWKDPEVVQKLHISDDQAQKLEKIAQDHQIQDVDLRADLEKQDSALRSKLQTDPPDEAQVFAQIDKVSQVRATLEKSHVEMLLAMRRILTAEQAQMLRDLRPNFAQPRPGFGPPDEGPGGPREGRQGESPNGPPEPPPNSDAN